MYSGFHELPRKQLVGTIIGLQLTLLLAALDQTIVSTAMPKIIASLNGFERYAWVTTAYMFTSTTAVPIFGKLSDIYGRKWILLGGAIFFVLTSALCGMAGEFGGLFGGGMNQLIVFRGLQGIAGGVIMAMTFTVIGDLFPPSERGKYQGLFSAVFALASIIGPALGGFITDNSSWRYVFYVNMPVGAIAIAVLYFAFPNIEGHISKRKIDYPGVATLIGTVVPLLLALTWVVDQGFASANVQSMLLLSMFMFVAFIYFERHAEEPIIPLKLFQDPIVTISCLSLVIVSIAMFGSILFIPLFMQSVIGVSATKSGSLLTPMMLMMTVGSVVSGQLTSRLGRYRIIALTGLAIMISGLFLLACLDSKTNEATILFDMMIVGAGLGLLMPVYTLVVQNVAPYQMIGAATAATQFFRSIGGTFGAALFGSVMMARYLEHLSKSLPPNLAIGTISALRNPLQLGAALGHLTGSSIIGHDLVQFSVRSALIYAIDGVFLFSAILVCVAFIANLFLKEVPLRKTHPMAGCAHWHCKWYRSREVTLNVV
jgi:EmrB/QacA subfamily drug resistance transporter